MKLRRFEHFRTRSSQAASVGELINPQHLDQYDKDPDTEVKIAGDLSAQSRRERHAALTEHDYQRALALGDEVGNTPV